MAQLVEHQTLDLRVISSSSTLGVEPTTLKKNELIANILEKISR